MRHYGYRRNARVAAVDENAVRNLVLFADNDGDLYRSRKTPIIENLAKKLAKGQFDASKAAKLFGYLAEDAAKKYAWEFGNPKPGTRSWHAQGADGNGLFNAPTRREAARRLLASNMEDIEDRARELGGASRRNPQVKRTKTAQDFPFSHRGAFYHPTTGAQLPADFEGVFLPLGGSHPMRRRKTGAGKETEFEYAAGDYYLDALGRWQRRRTNPARSRNPRASKYVYMYVLQGNYGYGHGWEDLAAEDKAVTGAGKRIRQTLKEYRENEGGNYRIIERREAK